MSMVYYKQNSKRQEYIIELIPKEVVLDIPLPDVEDKNFEGTLFVDDVDFFKVVA